MPKFHVARAFMLTRDDYSERHFAKGVHEIAPDDPDAEHFYFKANARIESVPVTIVITDPAPPAPSIVPAELQPAPTAAELEAAREREIAQEAREIARAAEKPAPNPEAVDADEDAEADAGPDDDPADLLDAAEGEQAAPARRRRRAK